MKKMRAIPLVMLFTRDVNKLEHDPASQYKFNRFWAIIWGILMISVPFVPKLYGHNSSALIIQEISLWANFATHFGAMSGALAAMNTRGVIEGMADDVQDIQEDTSKLDEVLPEVKTKPQPWSLPIK